VGDGTADTGYGCLPMSSAFVKEEEGGEAFEDLPDRPISPHPNFVTPEGLAAIEAELTRLHAAHAKAQDEDDRIAIAKTSRDLRYWTARRASAQVVHPPQDASEVHFGSTVTIERDDGRQQTYRLVGEDEADPAKGTISYVSPLARALTGKRVGDVVRAGTSDAEIVAIT
jgi:transcription elongation GreA/GreB family factor